MAIAVPTAAASGQKWRERAATSGNDYAEGVRGAGPRWQQGVQNAESTWAEGVQQAIGRGAFSAGVAGKGNKYSEKAAGIGASRWSAGIQSSQEAYESGVAPYLQAISNVTLPPRGARGNPINLERVRAVNEAARRVKESRG